MQYWQKRDTKQPRFYGNLCRIQVGTPKNKKQKQSLRLTGKSAG